MARRDPNNHTTFWRDRRVPGLSLLRADFTTHDYGPHTHHAFVIAVTESGGAEFSSRGTIDRMGAQTLFVSNPEERQSARMGGSARWRYRALYLEASAVDQVGHALGMRTTPYFMDNLIGDPALIARFGQLHRALESAREQTRADELLADELLVDAFGLLFRRHGEGGSRPEPAPRDRTLVRRVVEAMQARHTENLALQELAAIAGLTHFQLIGLFKRVTGLTPHAYLVQLRLNAACHELRRGRPLAEAALAAGFCDQSALTKHFKRSFGITPLQYAVASCAG